MTQITLRRTRLHSNPLAVHLDRSHDHQHGQSAVEMALILPLLLVLLAGIIIVVFVFYAQIQVTNAAREGARAGTLYRITANTGSSPSLDLTVKDAISNTRTSALGFLSTTPPSFTRATDVVCTVNGTSCSFFTSDSLPPAGARITVRLTYRYTLPVVSAALPMLPQPFVMLGHVTMEIQ